MAFSHDAFKSLKNFSHTYNYMGDSHEKQF